MDEYISKKKVLILIGCMPINPTAEEMDELHENVKMIDAADVRPVKEGKWVWDENGMDWNIGAWRCSCCGSRPATFWNTIHDNPFRFAGSKFCDNCGADMTGGAENG